MGKHKLPKAAEPYKFKKGVSGNPEGGRAHNPAIKALKKLTLETYREMIELVMTNNLTKIKKIAEDPNTPAVQVGIATAFMKAIKAGDYNVIEQIAARIIGKIPDVVHVRSTSVTAEANKIDKVKLKAAMKALEHEF